MLILWFDQMRPILPSRPLPQSQRAQGRSSKAQGLRVSGLCLTEPSTMASCFQSKSYLRPMSATAAECPIHWGQNSERVRERGDDSPNSHARLLML